MATVTSDQANRFGGEFYRCWTRRRLSQLDLATRAGTTQRYVSYVERGRRRRAERWSSGWPSHWSCRCGAQRAAAGGRVCADLPPVSKS